MCIFSSVPFLFSVLQSVSNWFPLRWPSGAASASNGLQGRSGAGLLGAEGKPPAPHKGRALSHTHLFAQDGCATQINIILLYSSTLFAQPFGLQQLKPLPRCPNRHPNDTPGVKNRRCHAVPRTERFSNHMSFIICRATASLTVLGLWWWASRRIGAYLAHA